jgi:hypothetical protein
MSGPLRYEPRLRVRVLAVFDLALIPILAIPNILLYGAQEFVADLPRHLRRDWKMIRYGTPGPYEGVIW